ncbi:MAG: class II fumarate hydratase [Cellvibrionaceae bacterium]|nr:class II fumarate hydratase [Cellvibrionaceae bacterium]
MSEARVRIETDTLGNVEVPEECYWGAQTQRSIENFPIGGQRFSPVFIRALFIVKAAAARTNFSLGKLDEQRCEWILRACEEGLLGRYNDQFPLVVWQTGSGTQTNMNANEVIANRANELAGQPRGGKKPVHPNDHVNLSQSSNDVFPTAMHIAAVLGLQEHLRPALQALCASLAERGNAFSSTVKIGRTHMMDATPLTLGQEFSGYVAQLEGAYLGLEQACHDLYDLALGGTAVGTGLNSHPEWATTVALEIGKQTGLPFRSAPNKFMALSAHDALLKTSAALRQLASVLLVIGNNLRLLASGPRCGFGELVLPANEPGSSIMPGKVNPTQIEALTMVAAQVIGNDTTVCVAASQAHLQLNVFKPVIIHNVLQSIELLADACNSFRERCVDGMTANENTIANHLHNSLMLVTALAPQIGYDEAAAVAKQAFAENKTLLQVVLEKGLMDQDTFLRLTDPAQMIGAGDGPAG